MNLPCLVDSRIGIENTGDDRGKEDQNRFGLDRNAEHHDHHWDQSNGGDRLEQVKYRPDNAVHSFKPAHSNAQRHANDRPQNIAVGCHLQAGQKVLGQCCPVRRLCVELGNQCGKHFDRAGQRISWDQFQNSGGDVPNPQKHQNGYHRNESIFAAFFLGCIDRYIHVLPFYIGNGHLFQNAHPTCPYKSAILEPLLRA